MEAPLQRPFYERVDRQSAKSRAPGRGPQSHLPHVIRPRRGGGGISGDGRRRDLARAIRAHAIPRLDHYLREFETNVQRRGGHVHWAATSEEAVAIVVDPRAWRQDRREGQVDGQRGDQLNPGLAVAGMEVLETDLGEYIVQLDDDHPSTS